MVPPMTRRALYLLLLVLLVAGGTVAYLFLTRDSATTTVVGPDGESIEASGPLLEARDALLAGPHDVEFELAVDIPKNSESDNPDHQEISAEGSVDFEARNAELVYDFHDLANAAGFLGHFDTMEVLFSEGTGYLDIFQSGPNWVSIEPGDASEDSVSRLRDLMLTTPMILPGLLEASATSPSGTGDELSREVDPATLSASEDELTAGLGAAFEDLEVDSILVETTLEDSGPAEVVVSFQYKAQEGTNTVQASYALAPTDEEVSVEAPDDSEVRTFSSIFS